MLLVLQTSKSSNSYKKSLNALWKNTAELNIPIIQQDLENFCSGYHHWELFHQQWSSSFSSFGWLAKLRSKLSSETCCSRDQPSSGPQREDPWVPHPPWCKLIPCKMKQIHVFSQLFWYASETFISNYILKTLFHSFRCCSISQRYLTCSFCCLNQILNLMFCFYHNNGSFRMFYLKLLSLTYFSFHNWLVISFKILST
jgi:hypothetical protein